MRDRIFPDQLPLGTGANQVYFIKTEGGWDVVSRIVGTGDGSDLIGQRCANAKQIKINSTLVANIIPVRAFCNSIVLADDEAKFLDVSARGYAAAVRDSPVLNQLYTDLGQIEFDWYLIEHDLAFVREVHSTMNFTSAPRLSFKMTLPGSAADEEVKQINAGLGISDITHEYFHALAQREAFEFESASVEETVAYLLSHAAAIEFGLTHAPTPMAYLKRPLDAVWDEAKLPNQGALDSSVAGLRLAFAMVEKARILDGLKKTDTTKRQFKPLSSIALHATAARSQPVIDC